MRISDMFIFYVSFIVEHVFRTNNEWPTSWTIKTILYLWINSLGYKPRLNYVNIIDIFLATLNSNLKLKKYIMDGDT